MPPHPRWRVGNPRPIGLSMPDEPGEHTVWIVRSESAAWNVRSGVAVRREIETREWRVRSAIRSKHPPGSGRRRWRWLSAIVVAAGLILGGWAWWTDRHYRAAMEEIESEIVAGRYAIACRNLDKLLSWKADPNGGIVYLLGSCELARGRNQAAAEAWERVVPGSAFSERAIRGRDASPPRIRATCRRRAAHQRGRRGSPQ